MTLYKNRVDAALAMIAEKQLNPTDVERICGVNRTQIYRWKAGEVKKMRYDTFYKLADKLGYSITHKKDLIETTPQTTKQKSGELNMNQQNMLIEYQQKEIAELKERVAKHKSTPIQSTVWDSLEYDYGVKLSLKFKNFKMGRTILEVGNKERISEVLGYSIQEIDGFWDIGTLYTNFKSHPVDAILSKETKKEIDKQILSLPNIFEALKDMMGSHYIPQPITYICKDKSFIHSIAYNKVDWKNKIVESKVQFLFDE